MADTKRYSKVFAAVLAVTFAFYYANTGFFYHCHTVGGVTVMHSHIHGSGHAGTEAAIAEITAVSALSLFQVLAAGALFFAIAVAAAVCEIYCRPRRGAPSASQSGFIALRAPPAVY